jgi:hypothetical protein
MLDIAKIIRSKNSGPYELTLDVMMDDMEAYERIKKANVLTNETIKRLYQVEEDDIITNMYFDPALAWKCTLKRKWLQGSVGERDTLGTQQHAPLMDIIVPAPEETIKTNGALKNGDAHVQSNGLLTNGISHVLPGTNSSSLPDRSTFSTFDSVKHIWTGLGLPEHALQDVNLEGSDGLGLPSSFKIGHVGQASIALSALGAALIHSLKTNSAVPRVSVPLQHAMIEYKSERLYVLDGNEAPSPWGPVGGLHKASDGFVRIHDSFPNHREGALDLLGCPRNATHQDVAQKALDWTSVDLETEAFQNKIVISALRSYRQWDNLQQARAIPNFPITIRKISSGPPSLPLSLRTSKTDKCLRGLRVLELSRVIAAPVAGRTLAAHGADVLWITSPNLPDLPTMDRDFARGKRTCQLDLKSPADLTLLKKLAGDTDVFIQGYRPSSIAARGLTPEALSALNPSGVVYASMSAYGPFGPWKDRRGFDSLVQTCSGMNVSEAEHFGDGSPARPTPCQALDHAGGYFLATGILAALYRRATEGGSYEVSVSLASTMKYLRSLGQYEGKSGFDCVDPEDRKELVEGFWEERETGFGMLTAIRHSASVEGVKVGWDIMPKPLGSDAAEWLT